MQSIDYIYRFDPDNPSAKPLPPDAAAAKRALEEGNRTFSRWMESCAANSPASGPARFVVMCNAWEIGVRQASDAPPNPTPFAVVVGCSD
ncbi:MAG: carbonic anhydrase, partial [Candidatus Saccharimonadales bacterium]